MPVSSLGAVFLSYAREDAAAARRIAGALRAHGVEVWFDEDELRGGDAWDAKIRAQIKECTLFMPVISAHTQARSEGYFRLEWRLADRRTELMGKSKAFLVPVCVDDTGESAADVPDSFLAVQWTRLPQGETPPAFCERVRGLLVGKLGARQAPAANSPERPGAAALPAEPKRRRWLPPAVAAILAVAALATWQRWRTTAPESPATTRPSAPASKTFAEVARLRARLIPHEWKKEDHEPWSATLDRIIAADDQDADAWALRSIINSLQVMRNFVADTKPLETGRAAANRALHLAPNSPFAHLALGMHHAAMISRGGDAQTARSQLRLALEKLPPDALTRYADLTTAWLGFDFDEIERAAKAWLKSEPTARFPAFLLGQTSLVLREATDAVKWAEQAASDQDITGMRAFVVAFDAQYYLRADLKAGRTVLDHIPAGARTAHRVLHARWLLAMAEERWDVALQELARTPEAMFYEGAFYGPKALLAGLAHRAAGRSDTALAQFREAERVLREHIANDAGNEPLRAVLALSLAYGGRPAEARSELALVEPQARGRARTMYFGRLMVLLAQANAALGQSEIAVSWLRELLSGPALVAFTPASLRIDPRFREIIATPEMQKLLADFAHLDAGQTGSKPSGEKSIAVLAFENRSSEKDSEYFSDGISDELLNVLGRIPGLRVIGRTSSFAFKGTKDTSKEIGQKLGVAYLVEGSVQRVGTRARIEAKLIRAQTDEVLWSDKFDTELKDIFAAQDEIAGKIAKNLSLSLGATSRVTKTVNPEAHALVLEGRHHFTSRSYEGFARAETAFAKALTIDPRFAEAQAGLAFVWITRGGYSELDGKIPPADDAARGKVAAKRTVELDPDLPAGHVALGYSLLWEGQFSEAEARLRTALSLNPNAPDPRHYLGLALSCLGRLDDSIAEHQRAAALDPLGWMNLQNLARALAWARHFKEAVEINARAATFRGAEVFIPNRGEEAKLRLALGQQDEAVRLARYLRQNLDMYPRWQLDSVAIRVLHRAGLKAEADDYANELFKKWPADHYQRGFVLSALDRFEEALPYLERTPAQPTRYLYWDEIWDRWRNDARFLGLIARLGRTSEYHTAREALARMLKEQEPPNKK